MGKTIHGDSFPVLFMIGDSTMSDKEEMRSAVEMGWGQALPSFFNQDIRIENHAKNGRSSRSFIEEGLWEAVMDRLNPDDWVIIQFGHNDNKDDPLRHTDPYSGYTANLQLFVKDILEKKAHPVICTSIVRGQFSAEGKLENSHGDYPAAAIKVALKFDIPLIDLEKETAGLISKLWPEQLKRFYVPEDNTHLTPWAASEVAGLAVRNIRKKKLTLACYLR